GFVQSYTGDNATKMMSFLFTKTFIGIEGCSINYNPW
ncbi:MAG: hypothetical protein JWL90_3608, partial [Chthoniobacteraceae bacterium]|nr:hypothetical protein [Chthoniobacteraceae bacterium]